MASTKLQDIFHYEMIKYAPFSDLYSYNLTVDQWKNIIPEEVLDLLELYNINVTKTVMDNLSRAIYLIDKYLSLPQNDIFIYSTDHAEISIPSPDQLKTISTYIAQYVPYVYSIEPHEIYILKLYNGNYEIDVVGDTGFDPHEEFINKEEFPYNLLILLKVLGFEESQINYLEESDDKGLLLIFNRLTNITKELTQT